jgi:hypothetical protein
MYFFFNGLLVGLRLILVGFGVGRDTTALVGDEVVGAIVGSDGHTVDDTGNANSSIDLGTKGSQFTHNSFGQIHGAGKES